MNFIDLQEQYRRYRAEIDGEIAKVMESARFIMGENVVELEKELAAYIGSKHAIGCSSGTDAILLVLMALQVKPGDEVIVPDFTFFATAETVSFLGSVPVFVDVTPDTYNMDPRMVREKVTARTKGVIAVSLFGQCADLDELHEVCAANGLFLVEDAAQSFGATYRQKKSGCLTDMATTSFFPAKPLGCYGDGGAVFTNDDASAELIRSLLNHGQGERYRHKHIGINGRLDALQAAILRVKLRHFDEELDRRQEIACWYDEALEGVVETPTVQEWNRSVWAQYTVRSERRETILEHLTENGIPTAIHYPIPLHRQEAFAALHSDDAEFPVSDKITREVFSLPMHPFLTRGEVVMIADRIKEAIR